MVAVDGRTILFVEDERLVADVVAEQLEEAGFQVRHALTGEEAVRLMEEGPALAALFTDIRLPGRIDGWRVAEAFRARNATTPVVYATGYAAEYPKPVENSRLLRKPYKVAAVLAAFRELGMPEA